MGCIMTSPAFAHSCLLPLPSTGVDPKESETSCVLNSTSVLLPQPETAHGSQTARILLVPLSVTLPTENPLSPPTVTEALQAPRRLHRLCPTSTLTSSPPTHPRITQLQPHRPLQAHLAPSYHETLICCLLPLPGTPSSEPEVDNFL